MTATELKNHWDVDGELSLKERIDKWIDLIHSQISVSSNLVKKNRKKNRVFLEDKKKKNLTAAIKDEFIEELKKKTRTSMENLMHRE